MGLHRAFLDMSGWWIRIALFLSCAIFLYALASYRIQTEEAPLAQRKQELEAKKERLAITVDRLEEMTRSLSDPSADEFALITRHGKAPTGAHKVLFKPQLPKKPAEKDPPEQT